MNPAKSVRSGPLPRVAEYVRLHARRRPRHPAVAGDGRLVSYASLHGHLEAMTQAIRALGLERGAHVAVGHSDLYVQLLIVFGFESLGIVTGSFRPDEGPDCHGLLAGADLTMSEQPPPPGLCRRFFEISDAWIAAALACPAPVNAPPPPPASAEDGAVVLRSSGTSGRPKRMVVTHGMLRTRVAHWAAHLGLDARSRFFSAMHFSMGTMHHTASACLRLGATFMFDFRHPLGMVLPSYQPTHLTLMPFQLNLLLDSLPDTETPLLPQLALSTVGGKFSPGLRQRARERLCGRLLEAYGTNEAYLHSVVDATGVGRIIAGIEVDVADSEGRSLPAGEIGQVRLHGDGVVREYLDDAAANAEMFRDGWFQPGDLATFVAPGQLRLVGRRTDVLNIGGRKIACVDLESEILSRTPVREVALLQRDDPSAGELVEVCVVADGPLDLATLGEAIRPVMKSRFAVQVVDAIPRTAEGKIRRGVLHDSLAVRSGDTPTSGHPGASLRQTVDA